MKQLKIGSVGLVLSLACVNPAQAMTQDAIVFLENQKTASTAPAASPHPNPSAKASPSEPSEAEQFVEAMYQIKKHYVEPVDEKKLFKNAIRGMMQGLDPHSDFLDEEEFSDLRAMTQGEFAGVGMEVTHDAEGYLKVISPVEGSPAAKSGIQPGDLILKIGNQSVKGMTTRDAVRLLRGDAGTGVTVTVFRTDSKSPKNVMNVQMVREVIKVPSVKSELLPGNYGYIRITQFQSHTGDDFIKAINDLKKRSSTPMQGLVLDLRNNPGGLLDAAIQVSDELLEGNKKNPEALILFTKGRSKEEQSIVHAQPGDRLKGIPMVTLINEGSASAAEIVAGALQDNRRSVLMGTRSFGKGSVQTIVPIGNKRGIKITTARYYTPSGRSIQAHGIEPDIVVDNVKVSLAKDEKRELSMHEADLQGHLKNDTQVRSNGLLTDLSAHQDLMFKDYQLYQALSLLKGMNTVQRRDD